MSVRKQPRYELDSITKMTGFMRGWVSSQIHVQGAVPIDTFPSGCDMGVLTEKYDTAVRNLSDISGKVIEGSKCDSVSRIGTIDQVSAEEGIDLLEKMSDLVGGEGAITERERRGKLFDLAVDVDPSIEKSKLAYGLEATYRILGGALTNHTGNPVDIERAQCIAIDAISLSGPTMGVTIPNLSSAVADVLGFFSQSRVLCTLQETLRVILAETNRCDSRYKEMEERGPMGSRDSLRPMVSWLRGKVDLELEGGTMSEDVIDDLFCGMSYHQVLAESVTKLEDLMDSNDDKLARGVGMDIDASERAEDDAKEKHSRAISYIEHCLLQSAAVVPMRVNSNCTVIVNPYGAIIHDGPVVMILSKDDLKELMELNSEIIATMAAVSFRFGKEYAQNYATESQLMYRNLASLGGFKCNLAPCAHRSIEGDGADDFLQNILSKSGGDRVWGRELETVFTSILERCPIENKYEWLRCFRALGQHRFSIPLITWQGKEVYGPTNPVSPAALDRIELALKLVIANSHKKNHNSWPVSMVESFPDVDFNLHNPTLDQMAHWTPNKDGIFDREATHVKDKRNIVNNWAVHQTAEKINTQEAEDTREVLYYSSRSVSNMIDKEISSVKAGVLRRRTMVVTVKPEQKKEGRQVSMEDAIARRLTSIVNNNAIPLLSSVGGNLMSISNKTKHARMDSIVKDLNDSSRCVTMNFMTDFKLFGNTFPEELTRRGYKVLGEYYGEDWIPAWSKRLYKQKVHVHHQGSLVTFMNTTGTNGQGMENGVWQLILGAIPYASAETLSSQIPGLSPTDTIKLVYFMDDHCFSLRLTIPRTMKGTYESWLRRKANSILAVLVSQWTPYGLAMQAEKTLVSIVGFILLGSVYNVSGIVPLVSKGVDAMLKPSTHRAPTVIDEIRSCEAAISSGQMSGGDPRALYLSLLVGVGMIISRWIPRKEKCDFGVLACKYFTPTKLGGMGGMTSTTMIPGACWIPDDERLAILFYHFTYCTNYRDICSSFLFSPAGEVKRGDWISNPLIRPSRAVKSPKSPLSRAIIAKLTSRGDLSLEPYRNSLDEIEENLISEYVTIPHSLPSALRTAHPHSVKLAELDFLCGSTSAHVLLGRAEIESCIRSARRSSIDYLLANEFGQGCVEDIGWSDYLVHVGYGNMYPSVSSVQRCPTLYVAEADNGSEYRESVRVSRSYGFEKTPILGSASTSTVPTQHIYMNPARSSLVTYVDTLVAIRKMTGGTRSRLEKLCACAWRINDIGLLSLSRCPEDPFNQLGALQVTPSLQAPSYNPVYNSMLIDTVPLYNLAQDSRVKLNHGVLVAHILMDMYWNSRTIGSVWYAAKEACLTPFVFLDRSSHESSLKADPEPLSMMWELGGFYHAISSVKPSILSITVRPSDPMDMTRQTMLRASHLLTSVPNQGASTGFQQLSNMRANAIEVNGSENVPVHGLIDAWLSVIIRDNENYRTSCTAILSMATEEMSLPGWSELKNSRSYKSTIPTSRMFEKLSRLADEFGTKNRACEYLSGYYVRNIIAQPYTRSPGLHSQMHHMVEHCPKFWIMTLRRFLRHTRRTVVDSFSANSLRGSLSNFTIHYEARFRLHVCIKWKRKAKKMAFETDRLGRAIAVYRALTHMYRKASESVRTTGETSNISHSAVQAVLDMIQYYCLTKSVKISGVLEPETLPIEVIDDVKFIIAICRHRWGQTCDDAKMQNPYDRIMTTIILPPVTVDRIKSMTFGYTPTAEEYNDVDVDAIKLPGLNPPPNTLDEGGRTLTKYKQRARAATSLTRIRRKIAPAKPDNRIDDVTEGDDKNEEDERKPAAIEHPPHFACTPESEQKSVPVLNKKARIKRKRSLKGAPVTDDEVWLEEHLS